jgi:hypothetical protein
MHGQNPQGRALHNSKKPTSTKGLKPKILNESPPVGKDQSEEVRQHNKEMEERADRAHVQIKNEDAYKDKMSPKEEGDKKKA